MPNSCSLPPKKPTGKPTSTTSSSAEKSRLLEFRLLQKLWDEHKKIPRPNKHKDRSGWNLHFEREISFKWAFHERDLFDESIPRLRWPWETSSIEELNHTIAFSSDGLMVQEGILIALAVENLVDRDFEKGWNELDVEKKKENVLEGLYRGACACPRDNSRISCPEMTIDGLAGDGEYNFISLLRRIVVHDPTADGCVRELYLFSHPFVEREFALSDDAPDKERAFVTSMVILRNFYIVEALIGILEAYHDVIPSHHPPLRMSATLRTEERREAKNIARAEARKGAYRVDDSQIRENAIVSKNACASCYKTTDNRNELKKCSRCQLTWYCSRDCQRNHWNTHKVFCGKRHFEPEVLAPKSKGPKLFIGCPDSEPGFVRSPALWRQIQYLGGDDSQTQVYHLDKKNHKHTISLGLGHLSNKQHIFLVARRRAMASGSLSAVALMLQMLQNAQRNSEYTTPEGIQRQLEREYRVDLSPAELARAPPFAPPSREEWEEEGLYFEQRMEKAQAWGLSKLEGMRRPKCCPGGCGHHLSSA